MLYAIDHWVSKMCMKIALESSSSYQLRIENDVWNHIEKHHHKILIIKKDMVEYTQY